MRNFKDESFIAQYLSPKVMRDLKLFAVVDDDVNDYLEVSKIHNDAGYRDIRTALAEQYNLGSEEPHIEVYNVDVRTDRALTLRHKQYNRKPLSASAANAVLKHLYLLWGFPVKLESIDLDGKVVTLFEK